MLLGGPAVVGQDGVHDGGLVVLLEQVVGRPVLWGTRSSHVARGVVSDGPV